MNAPLGVKVEDFSGPAWPALQTIESAMPVGEAFPLDALPPLMRAAVEEYQAYGQQPLPMIASCALAVLAVAGQGLADVARDSRLRGPSSLNVLIIAASGERKSAADSVMGKALKDWERERRDAVRPQIEANERERASWLAAKEGIESAVKQAAKKGDAETQASHTQRLTDHMLCEPRKLILPTLLLDDVTPEQLAVDLQDGHPSAALWSAEGGTVTGGAGMGRESVVRFLATLNKLWDGSKVSQRRKSVQSAEVEDKRLSVCLQIQPSVLQEFMRASKGLAKGSGFWARFLLCWPETTKGARPYCNPAHMSSLDAFNARIRELLDIPLPLDEQGRIVTEALPLSTAAKVHWVQFHNRIERELGPRGALSEASDTAAKSAENAARLACQFHVFEHGPGGVIDLPAITAGCTIAGWFAYEALRVLNQFDPPQGLADAHNIESWLLANEEHRTPRDLQQRGPVRDVERRDAALLLLESAGRVCRRKESGATIIELHPDLISGIEGIATATSATSATSAGQRVEYVADVAKVAVAIAPKVKIEPAQKMPAVRYEL